MNEEQKLEKELQDKGLNAPRVSPEVIDSLIVKEQFHVFPESTVTVCCLTLKNGFTTIGESACADVKNFDEEVGKKIARKNARERIWLLEGYLLRQRLHDLNEVQNA